MIYRPGKVIEMFLNHKMTSISIVIKQRVLLTLFQSFYFKISCLIQCVIYSFFAIICWVKIVSTPNFIQCRNCEQKIFVKDQYPYPVNHKWLEKSCKLKKTVIPEEHSALKTSQNHDIKII